MSFSASIAKKYIFAQKRNSALTVFSIAAAVALITLLFTIYSTYSASMLEYERRVDPWHATVHGLTSQEAEQLEASGAFEKTEFVPHADNVEGTENTSADTMSDLHILFNKSVDFCDEQLENVLRDNGIAFSSDGFIQSEEDEVIPVVFHINARLLRLENIGVDAKAYNVQMFSLFYIFILFTIFCARLVIDTAFEISSKEREKQFGVLQSIGASKRQIAKIVMCEGGYLSLAGIPLGLLLGTGTAYGIYLAAASSRMFEELTPEGYTDPILMFSLPPLYVAVIAATGLIWVLLSAYGTGMRAAKMSPVEAIRSRGGAVKKIKRRSLFGFIFGWTGTLAARNIRRGKKRFVITILSMTFSMVLFIGFVYSIELVVDLFEEDYASSPYDFIIYTDYEDDISYSQLDRMLSDCGLFEDVVCTPSMYFYGNNLKEPLPLTDEFAEHRQLTSSSGYLSDYVLWVQFVNEDVYKRIMGDVPQISYSQLAQEDGFILLNKVDTTYYNADGSREEKTFQPLDMSVGDSISAVIEYHTELDEPYEVGSYYVYTESHTADVDLKILGITDNVYHEFYSTEYGAIMIGTYDQYESIYSNYEDCYSVNIIHALVSLKRDEDHDRALEFIERNNFTASDTYEENQVMQSTIAVVKVLGYSLLGIISLIAAVNMINVVSTGMINRRPEIAAMRSLGMSEKQLTKLILIECGQYAMISGIAATAVSELLLFLTVKSMNLFDLPPYQINRLINYRLPIVYALMAMAAAFVCAAAAAMLPLRRIGKSSITEEMKRID